MPMAALGVRGVLRLLSALQRREIDAGVLASIDRLPDAAIIAYWHDQTVVSAGFMIRVVLPRRRLASMTSHSDDGELVARVARPLGVRMVRGSASRGGREGLRELYRDLTRQGGTLVMLPDGPRGPRHRAKLGVVTLAQLAQAPVLPLAFACRRGWRLRSWDRMTVPYPGTRVAVVSGEPLEVPRQLDESEREALRARLDEQLETLSQRAQDLADQRTP